MIFEIIKAQIHMCDRRGPTLESPWLRRILRGHYRRDIPVPWVFNGGSRKSVKVRRRLCYLERSFPWCFHLLPTKNGPGPGQPKYSDRAGANPGLLRHGASLVGVATPSFFLTRECRLENKSRKFWGLVFLAYFLNIWRLNSMRLICD